MTPSTRSRPIAVATALLATVLLTTLSPAAAPEGDRDVAPTVWFQGFLADSVTGDPVNATYTVVARIYSLASGGALLWGPETHASTPIVEGWFNIELGATVSPLPSFEVPPYYLELVVNGETLSPRSKLASVPSALKSSATVADDGDWTISGDNIYRSTGNVAVGTTTTTQASLAVEGTAALPTLLLIETDGGGMAPVLSVVREESASGAVLELMAPQAPTGGNFIHCFATTESGFYSPLYIDNSGHITGLGGARIYAESTGSDDYAVMATSVPFSADTKVLHAAIVGSGPYDAVAVYGESTPQDRFGYGGYFVGGHMGAKGEAIGTGTGYYYGLYGLADTPGAGWCYGVRGNAHGAGVNYGVYASAADGTTNWAGYFSGNVRVTGTLTNPLAGLEIDDPTDPANGYLRHPYVASSEMKTVYDGTAVLDGSGEVWVEMPDWFEALNAEFRYQLTAIGAPGPNLYVAEKVSGNRFRIAGGEPGMEVCWQVTGVRHDAVAQARGFDVRVPKSGEDRGRYLDPAAHGAADDREIGPRDEKLKD